MNKLPKNPYQSPLTAGEDLSWQDGSRYRFIPLRSLSRMLVIALALDVGVGFVFSMVDSIVETVFPNIYESVVPTPAEEQILVIMNVFTFVMFAVGLVTTVLACVFIYRANANLRSAGATELTYSPAWSVGWWFVPILHLFKPYFAVKEIYLWSYANAREEADVQPRRFLLPVWWLFWVVCYFVGLISTLIYFYSSFDPSVNFLLSAVESLLYVAAGVCFIIIVSRIADWQERMESSRDTTSESAGVSSAIT